MPGERGSAQGELDSQSSPAGRPPLLSRNLFARVEQVDAPRRWLDQGESTPVLPTTKAEQVKQSATLGRLKSEGAWLRWGILPLLVDGPSCVRNLVSLPPCLSDQAESFQFSKVARFHLPMSSLCPVEG
jgi:hypothetical protein